MNDDVLFYWVLICRNRIYNTFLAPDATLPLRHVTTGKQVRRDLQSLEWSILTQEDVTDVLKDTEDQVETKMVSTRPRVKTTTRC